MTTNEITTISVFENDGVRAEVFRSTAASQTFAFSTLTQVARWLGSTFSRPLKRPRPMPAAAFAKWGCCMTDAQLAALLMAAPFLTLCAIWMAGSAILALIGDDQ